MTIVVASTQQRNDWFAGFQAVATEDIYGTFCVSCSEESFWQGSSSNMRDQWDVGIEWMPRVGGKKRHGVSVESRAGRAMCGRRV
jgi:hypothetical protein